IEKVWNSVFPNGVFDSRFVNDSINNNYESERVMSVLFKVFAGVIIFISFIGLFGLISFVATQRTKEVAIRKVLGASTIELMKMLNGSFLIMVFIANLMAWPLAYLFVSKWLSGFAYRIDISIWPFAMAMIISMAITLITVSIRSYKAAVANTIDALKYE
ncbi:MAG: FtsX-like permease family protein, partial [Pedobacter sp.]